MFKRLTQGIAKTRQNRVAGIKSLTGTHQQLTGEDIESLETALLMADCGVEATNELIETTNAALKRISLSPGYFL